MRFLRFGFGSVGHWGQTIENRKKSQARPQFSPSTSPVSQSADKSAHSIFRARDVKLSTCFLNDFGICYGCTMKTADNDSVHYRNCNQIRLLAREFTAAESAATTRG